MRALLVRNDRLGDMVLALPAAAALKAQGHSVGLLASAYTAPLALRCPDLDEVVVDGPSALATLRSGKWDAAACLWATPANALKLWRAGIPRRLGADGRLASLLFTQRVALRRSSGQRHESEYNLELARALVPGLPESAPAPRLEPRDEDRLEAAACLSALGLDAEGGPLVLVHPGMGGSALNWKPERYAELALGLKQRFGARVLFTGGPSERPALKGLAERAGALALDRDLSLPGLAALIARAQLFASGSTGPMHVAGALGVPTLSVFPPVRPMAALRWAPRGNRRAVLSPAGLGQDCPRCKGPACALHDCMDRISVDEALAACGALLRG